MLKFQNYSHYKLPITMNPLEYGKLILQIDELNLFIIQVNKTNVVLIYQHEELNHIKLFKEGELIFEYKDHKSSDNSFIRSIENKKFNFSNGNLVEISINKVLHRVNGIIQFINSTTLLKLDLT